MSRARSTSCLLAGGQLKTKSDIDLSLNYYHHLRDVLRWGSLQSRFISLSSRPIPLQGALALPPAIAQHPRAELAVHDQRSDRPRPDYLHHHHRTRWKDRLSSIQVRLFFYSTFYALDLTLRLKSRPCKVILSAIRSADFHSSGHDVHSYQTPTGVVSGIQWVPAEATQILPQNAIPANQVRPASADRPVAFHRLIDNALLPGFPTLLATRFRSRS